MRTSSLPFVVVAALLGCEPVDPPPFAPLRDASFDADLDAPRADAARPDAPRADAPSPDAYAMDGAAVVDAPEPDPDAGETLPIDIDGLLLEPAWEDAVLALSTAGGVGAFDGCRLASLRGLSDGANIYLAIEGALCRGAIVAYIDTGSPGVLLGMAQLGDRDGAVDAVLSRSWTLVDTATSPRFGWGSAEALAAPGPASATIGWRELSQDGPHRPLAVDLSACGGEACETRVPRAALGSPRRLRIAVRLATPDEGSLLALPLEGDADIALNEYATLVLP